MKIKVLFKMTHHKDQDRILFIACSELTRVHLLGHSCLILNFYRPWFVSMMARDRRKSKGVSLLLRRPCLGPAWLCCFLGHCVVCLGKCASIKASMKLLLLTQYLYLQGSHCKDDKGWRPRLKMRLVTEGEGKKV